MCKIEMGVGGRGCLQMGRGGGGCIYSVIHIIKLYHALFHATTLSHDKRTFTSLLNNSLSSY